MRLKGSAAKRESVDDAESHALSGMAAAILPRARKTCERRHLQGCSMVQEGGSSWGATRGRAKWPDAHLVISGS